MSRRNSRSVVPAVQLNVLFLLSVISLLSFGVTASGQQNQLAKEEPVTYAVGSAFFSPELPFSVDVRTALATASNAPGDEANLWKASPAVNAAPGNAGSRNEAMRSPPAGAGRDSADDTDLPVTTSSNPRRGIHWWKLVSQEMLYISFKQVDRIATEEKTRRELGGPYFKDWGYILNHLNLDRWSDGGRWTTNNIYHSADGAVFGFIYKRNDDNAKYLEFDLKNPAYRKSLLKAWAVAAVASAESEIGPLSEATIGHVGLKKDWRGENGTGWTDFIMTPCGGVALMMGEDAVDKHLTARWEQHLHNRFLIKILRIASNPSRSLANIFTITTPWHRDTRDGYGRTIAEAK